MFWVGQAPAIGRKSAPWMADRQQGSEHPTALGDKASIIDKLIRIFPRFMNSPCDSANFLVDFVFAAAGTAVALGPQVR